MTTDIDMVGITQCRQRLNGQGTEGVRYAVEVVKNRPPLLSRCRLPFLSPELPLAHWSFAA